MNKNDYTKNLNPYNNAHINYLNNCAFIQSESNSGICTDLFTSLEDCCNIHITGEIQNTDTEIYFRLCLYNKENTEKEVCSQKIETDSDNCFKFSYTFDPVSLSIYQDAVSFRVFLYSNYNDTEFKIKEFFIDNKKNTPKTNITYKPVNNITVDSDKNRCVIVKWLDGTKVFTPIVPKKVLFIGNSLLLGMFTSYGMCSTDSKSDYAYHVEQKILSVNPECTFKKLYASTFEHSETDEEALNWFNSENLYSKKPAIESFDADTDLIILQITDNVNTDAKISVFKKNVDQFITTIKKQCHNARIIWVFGWYNKYNTYEKLIEVSQKYSIELVDISELHHTANEAFSGQTCINAEGESVTVRDTWITHPGNNGMKAIADKIIKTLGI